MKAFVLTVGVFFSVALYANPSIKPQEQAVASAHPAATQAGIDVLNQGGNAFDAAVAVSAALAVVEPFGSGIGGGGFWLLHRESDGFQVMVDGREVAPLKADRDMYLDKQGEPIKNASVNGALAAGIPGLPAALDHLAKKYGKLPLSDSLKPAIELAEKGFLVNEHYRRLAKFRQIALASNPSAEAIFLSKGQVPDLGAVIQQEDLAETLKQLSKQGFDGFYAGEVADKLVQGVQQAGGIWTKEDLKKYRVKERSPVVIDYKDMKVVSAALPSSGGLVLSIALNILEQYDLESLDEATRIHVVVEAMRRAYRDRALYMGDSDFVSVPTARLTHKSYAHTISKNLSLDTATSSQDISGLKDIEGNNTTHFSVMDKAGNRVAATLSINYPFGSGFVPAGTGVLLNDEMDDFSIKPGTPNVYGLVGGQANAIEAGKRMLSSMSPTFIETKEYIGVLGTPGGSRIISMVLLGILDAEQGHTPESWVNLPRYHHQYLPDVIQHEPGTFKDGMRVKLKEKGHQLKSVGRQYGNMHAILWDKKSNTLMAASDRRGSGLAIVETVGINE
ncbi:MAG: gamma-glutamyltransferase [Cycloclasticus sp.]|nr:gamma-glutamyltransferase [Cycloclasticus sp.]MBG96678.1 gamma-glutamyltransferase [Cycloclasticus sp.]HAI97093.1 gamma-glutamyltransferase [Methylococcaceae bacterium]